jgi:hypothetical protein
VAVVAIKRNSFVLRLTAKNNGIVLQKLVYNVYTYFQVPKYGTFQKAVRWLFFVGVTAFKVLTSIMAPLSKKVRSDFF